MTTKLTGIERFIDSAVSGLWGYADMVDKRWSWNGVLFRMEGLIEGLGYGLDPMDQKDKELIEELNFLLAIAVRRFFMLDGGEMR